MREKRGNDTVLRNVCSAILAENQIFLLKQKGTRLERKTKGNNQHGLEKLSSKDCSEGFVSMYKVKQRVNTARKILCCKTTFN